MDIYELLQDFKNKNNFIHTAAISLLNNAERDGIPEGDVITGLMLSVDSLGEDLQKIRTSLDNALHDIKLLQSARNGITMTKQGAWSEKEKAISVLKEHIDDLNFLREHYTGVLKESEELIIVAETLLKKLGQKS